MTYTILLIGAGALMSAAVLFILEALILARRDDDAHDLAIARAIDDGD